MLGKAVKGGPDLMMGQHRVSVALIGKGHEGGKG
jgi:hypothetical protein